MFGTLSDKFSKMFRKLSGKGKISESNVREAMEEVRAALLEADVHLEVVDRFCKSVVEKAVGTEVLASLKPGQQIVQIVYQELVELMGGADEQEPFLFVQPGPTVIMMCGLQGSGKTTTCGKLALQLLKREKTVLLAAGDLQRPAAVHQLEVIAKQIQDEHGGAGKVHFYAELDKVGEYGTAVGAAVGVCRNALAKARGEKCDVVILDTAGRLHIDDDLMGELRQINQAVGPHQILLVTDAMTGQDAVNSAKAFNEQLELDGVILTKFDSDTRGGAALSVRQITGQPIKWIGIGEKLEALEEFHADRVASRILGMGDVLGLVEKAQEQVSQEEAEALQAKLAKGKMTMDDFLKQLNSIRKMGPLKSLLGMLPGVGSQLKDLDLDESQINRTQAIIQSMTKEERENVDLLDNSRRRRIARGSGTRPEDVSHLVKGFSMVCQFSKQMAGMGMVDRLKTMAGMGGGDLASLAGMGRGAMPQLPGKPPANKSRFKTRKKKSR